MSEESSSNKVEFTFAEVFLPLLKKSRYKVAWSGRGAGKSWFFATYALARGMVKPERILCAREIQKSIAASIHQLLKDRISQLGIDDFYHITETAITGKNGTLFSYIGLKEQTKESMKSYEGYTILLADEAQAIKERSWNVALPTIRKAGSEIWIAMNPDMETNYTWQQFVVNSPPDSIVVGTSYKDNIWHSDESESLRLHHFNTMKAEDYENIWEGKCRTTISGAIYSYEMGEVIKSGRYGLVPYDPRLKVHTVWDLGFSDATAIILAQVIRSECRIIGYLEGRYKTDDWWAATLNNMKMNWGKDYLPHDAEHHDHKTRQTTRDILNRMGRRVATRGSVPGPNILSRDMGIQRARQLFPKVSFDNKNAGPIDDCPQSYNGVPRLIECLKQYRRNIPTTTDEPADPVRDEYSHGADAFRYLALCVDKMTNEDSGFMPLQSKLPKYSIDPTMGTLG